MGSGDNMDFITDLLSNLVDLLVSFFVWVGTLIDGLVNVAVQVGKAITALPHYLTWLPEGVIAVLLASFTIVAAYKILGREG